LLPADQQLRHTPPVDDRRGDGNAGEAGTEHATIATSIAASPRWGERTRDRAVTGRGAFDRPGISETGALVGLKDEDIAERFGVDVRTIYRWKRVRVKGRVAMGNVEHKTGGYSIPAHATQEFTFWWGSDAVPTAYFDVSIEPNPKVFDMKPLIEEKRELTLFGGAPRQPMLILTLKNNNSFAVVFFANHVRIYG
jgi:hypothetical protein